MSSKSSNQKLHFPRSKHSIHYYFPCQFRRLISDCSTEEKEIFSILNSCSHEAPCSTAGDLAGNRIKYNIGTFYNKIAKLSYHERWNIAHNV